MSPLSQRHLQHSWCLQPIRAALHLAGWDSPGDSLAPGALLPAMAKQDVAQQHSGSDVPKSSWTTERKKSLRVLAAAEVRL